MLHPRKRQEIKDEGTRSILNAVKASSSDIEHSFRKFEVKRRQMAKQQDFVRTLRTQRMQSGSYGGNAGVDQEKATLKSISMMETKRSSVDLGTQPHHSAAGGGKRRGIKSSVAGIVSQTPEGLLAASMVPVGARRPSNLLQTQKGDYRYHTPAEDLLDLAQGYSPNPNSPYAPCTADLVSIQRALKGGENSKTRKKLELKFQSYAQLEEKLGLTDPAFSESVAFSARGEASGVDPFDKSQFDKSQGPLSASGGAATTIGIGGMSTASPYYQEMLEILYSTDPDHVIDLPQPSSSNKIWGSNDISSKRRPPGGATTRAKSASLMAPATAMREHRQSIHRSSVLQDTSVIQSNGHTSDGSNLGGLDLLSPLASPKVPKGTAIKTETLKRQSMLQPPVGVERSSLFPTEDCDDNEHSMAASTMGIMFNSSRRSSTAGAGKKKQRTDEELEARRRQKEEDTALLKSLESPPRDPNAIVRWWKRNA